MDSLQWQSFIKSCLDILRNGDSKYDGLKAINEFITLITLKLVEHRICEMDEDSDSNDDKIRIGLDCKFTYLYENYCIHNKEIKDKSKDLDKKAIELFDILYNHDRIWDIEDEMDDNLNHIGQTKKRNNNNECIIHRFNKYTKDLNKLTDNVIDVKTFTSFTNHHRSDVQKLVSKIQETFGDIDIEHFTYDAFGEAYEKMIADELGNNSKRSGQYFTKRDLIKYIIDELNIKETDLCYDPACGTGGFLLGFASKFKTNKSFIENNIYGQEYLDEVYKTLNFNMLANNFDKSLQNISKGDSIRDFNYHSQVKNKFDKVGANPPFGISIEKCPPEYPINKIKNSVALFLQHIYFSLKDGGQAGIVIDRGILNNGTDKKNAWEGKLRKFLLEKTSITKIINLPTGIFKHTNFATSVIFFTKGLPTSEIKYIEGYFKNEDKGKGEKQMYLGHEKILKIKNIKDKNYSLKYDDYFKIETDNSNDTKGWVKLGDVCELKRGKTLTLTQINEGEYPVIGGGQKPMGFHDEFNRNENTILVSQSGSYAGYLSKYDKKVWASDCFSIEPKDDSINKIFLWYYLKINQENIYKLQHGNGQPHVNTNDMNDFLIPNLSLSHQEEIVKFLDEIYQTAKIEDTIKYLKDKPIFNLLIDRNYDGFKDIIYFQENIPKLLFELENIPKKKKLQIQSIFQSYRGKSEMKKLGDIVKFDIGGTPSTKENKFWNGDNLWVSVSELNGTIINDTIKKITDEGVNKSSVKLVKKDSIMVSFKLSFGKLGIAGKDMYCNEAIMFFKHDNNITNKYLYNWFSYNDISKYASGQIGGGNLNKTSLFNIQIPIPSLDLQEEIIKKIQALEQESSHYNEYSKMLEKELSNITEIINNMTTSSKMNEGIILNEENNIINEENDEELNDQEDDAEEEEYDELEIKGITYILEDENVYVKKDDGQKGQLYGYYKNDKFTRIKKVKSNVV